MILVVNMIPRSLSGETNQDSEPNIAVNPANPLQLAGSAFTPDPAGGPNAPIFVSNDGGNTWLLNSILPGQAGSLTGTGDITVRFAATSNTLYAGILRLPGFLRLNILRTTNFLGAATMTVLVDRGQVDQPYVQATTVGGHDRVYVGLNDFAAAPQTATIDESFDAEAPLPPGPTFTSARIETRGTSGQDGPPIRVAIHSDGTVYGIFYGWRAFDGTAATTDVVVVRDDNAGIGATPFTALVDVDGLAGMRVVQNRTVPFLNFSQPTFGQERFVGSNISIAVDPNNSSIVYIAWADQQGDDYTLHVRRSADRGVTWTPNDLRTIANATNPALAVNDRSMVGFLYQEVVGAGADQRWMTHLELTEDGFASVQDFVLANVPAMTPPPVFVPYIGDYVHLMAAGSDFHGIFSANNTPDLANFPNGVRYQRNADFTTRTLLDNNNQPVAVSIDPYYVRLTPPSVRPTVFEYAAKFLCGLQRDPEDTRLTRGLYATEVNIHNPNDTEVKFFKKLALTYPPEAQRPGEVLPIGEDVLRPDEALAVDCTDLQRRLFPNGLPAPYITGFLVIESPASLDVTAVYTVAALDRAGRVTEQSGIDVEQIRERRKGGEKELPDLVPVPDASGSFCRRRDGKLVVTVKNQGAGPAGPSTTQVDFFAHGQVSQPTPPLAPNASTELLFDIPPGCFDPDCNFRITVDVNGEVAESNEGNNTADGICLG
jgi:CARDB